MGDQGRTQGACRQWRELPARSGAAADRTRSRAGHAEENRSADELLVDELAEAKAGPAGRPGHEFEDV
jgi:hypothetical protein